jgi:hypothetical protein
MSDADIAAVRPPATHWWLLARISVSALLLVYVFRNAHWSELLGVLGGASPVWLLAGWLFFGIPMLLTSIRLRWLLQLQGVRIPLERVVAITCVGQFFNMFLLGSTGGDAVRLLYILREAPDAKARAGIAMVADRALGLVVLDAIALAAVCSKWSLFMGSGDLRRIVWILCAILAVSIMGVAILILAPLPRLSAALRLPAKIAGGLAAVQQAARQYARAPGGTLAAVAVTVPVHLSNSAGGYCAARALNLPVGYASIAVILAIVFFVISIPVTVSGHGLRESIFVLMFSLFGVGASAALLYSLCYLAFTLAWSLACGPVYLGFRGRPVSARMNGVPA